MFRTLWYCGALVLVVAAVLISVFRFTAPLTNRYTSSIEQWVSAVTKQQVQFDKITASWRGLGPSLRLHQLSLLNRARDNTLIAFDTATIDIDILASVRQWRIVPGTLSVEGVNVKIERRQDGQVVLAALQTKTSNVDTRQSTQVMHWLFTQPRLQLGNANIVWHDLQTNERLTFNHIELELLNNKTRHILRGDARLPRAVGKRLRVALDLKGPGVDFQAWQGKLFLHCTACKLAAVNRYLGAQSPWHIQNGVMDLQPWAKWDGQQLSMVEGQLQLRQPQLRQHNKVLADFVSTRFAWRPTQTEQHVRLENLQVTINGRQWPRTRLIIQKSARYLAVQSGYLNLSELSEALLSMPLLPEKLQQNLTDLQLGGEIQDLRLQLNRKKIRHFLLDAKVTGLHMQHWQNLPQLTGVDGAITLNERSGWLRIDSMQASAYWPKLLRNKIQFDTIAGNIAWLKTAADNWHIGAQQLTGRHADLALQARLNLRLDLNSQRGHFIDLGVAFSHGNLQGLRQYLALRNIPKKIGQQINNIVLQATLQGGGIVLQGRLNKYPFVAQEGKFLIETDLSAAHFAYAESWPVLTDAKTHLQFDGASARMRNGSGSIFRAKLSNSQLHIKKINTKTPQLHFTTSVEATTKQSLKFLLQSPLQERFGVHLKGARAGRKTAIQLDIKLPLRGANPAQVKGSIKLSHATLNLRAIGVRLDAVNGQFRFHNEKFTGKNIRAKIWDMPTQFNVSTETANKHNYTIIHATGQMDIAHLQKRFALGLFQYAHGAADWQGKLRIRQARGILPAQASLQLESNLEGIEIKLPAPLAKIGPQKRAFTFTNHFSANAGHTLRVSYQGGKMRGVFYAENNAKGVFYDRGELRFGGAPATLPPQKGLRIAGFLPYYSHTKWNKALFPTQSPTDVSQTQNDMADLINNLDVSIQEVELLGYGFQDVHLKGTRNTKQWQAQVTSVQAQGQIQLPLRYSQDALVLNMQRLYLNAIENPPKSQADPRQLPAITARINDFRHEHRIFGKMDLVVTRQNPGLEIQSLKLSSPIADIDVHGRWFVYGDQQKTDLSTTVNSPNMGKLLENFGFVNSMSDGQAHFVLDLNWAGKPADFDYAILNGHMALNINNGRLLEIEPGAGRLFGLFSFQALPRRLALDFTDFFQKGFKFDNIQGDFALNDGNAYTGNLVIVGPAGTMQVTGRAGLYVRDYDQQVTIIPEIGSTLPWAGLLVGEPQLGAVIFITQKLFSPHIQQMTRYTYALTGSWDSPIIAPIKKETSGTVGSNMLDDDSGLEEFN